MVIPIVPSKSKKIFLFSVVILIFLFLFLLFHKSENPILWNYSAHFLLFLFLYFGFLIVCLFSYFKIDKLGLKYCTFLLCIYILSFALVDFIIGSKYYYSSTRLKDHPVYHHTLLPGVYNLAVTGVSFLDRKYIIMHVNSLGLRSMREISLRKPQNHFRILLLGDSFTEGKGVETNETFAYLLEEYLNSSEKNVLRYEILNSGVDSYAPLPEYLYLMTDGEGRKQFGIQKNYTAPPDLSYMLERKFKEKGIPTLNLFPVFRSYDGKEWLYYKVDMHWTKIGHKMVADQLFKFVNQIYKNPHQ